MKPALKMVWIIILIIFWETSFVALELEDIRASQQAQEIQLR